MPVYDYKCQHCGKFEIVQRITAPPLEECPTCGGKVERLISRNVGIVFKGPGFYTTDSREKTACASLTGRGKRITRPCWTEMSVVS